MESNSDMPKMTDEAGQKNADNSYLNSGEWKNDQTNNDFSSQQLQHQLQLQQQMVAMHQQQMQMQMNSNVVPFPSGPAGLPNAISQQQKQHQMTVAAMSQGLPVHMFARIAQLPIAQQQLFHHHHQLYLHKLQQLQQAQARGQQVPPQQIQMLQAHQHYLAVLASTPAPSGGHENNTNLENLNATPGHISDHFGFSPNGASLNIPSGNNPFLGLSPPPASNMNSGNLGGSMSAVNLQQQQQQQFNGISSNAGLDSKKIKGNKSNMNTNNTMNMGTTNSNNISSSNGMESINQNQNNNEWYMDNQGVGVSSMNPMAFNHSFANNMVLHPQNNSMSNPMDPSSNMMFNRFQGGPSSVPPDMNMNIPNYTDPHLGLPSSQKIPLPPWLQSHGEKRHSEKQLVSTDDLTSRKKKYRLSLCIYCSKVYPQSPWATLKSRKFEHEIFRKHEKSSLHQRALLELNKSAVSGNPATLQLALGAMPMMGALQAAKRAAFRQQRSPNNTSTASGTNANNIVNEFVGNQLTGIDGAGNSSGIIGNIPSFNEFYSNIPIALTQMQQHSQNLTGNENVTSMDKSSHSSNYSTYSSHSSESSSAASEESNEEKIKSTVKSNLKKDNTKSTDKASNDTSTTTTSVEKKSSQTVDVDKKRKKDSISTDDSNGSQIGTGSVQQNLGVGQYLQSQVPPSSMYSQTLGQMIHSTMTQPISNSMTGGGSSNIVGGSSNLRSTPKPLIIGPDMRLPSSMIPMTQVAGSRDDKHPNNNNN